MVQFLHISPTSDASTILHVVIFVILSNPDGLFIGNFRMIAGPIFFEIASCLHL